MVFNFLGSLFGNKPANNKVTSNQAKAYADYSKKATAYANLNSSSAPKFNNIQRQAAPQIAAGVAAATAAPASSDGGGGYGGGYGGGGGGFAAAAAPAPAPPRLSDDEWLNQDSGYKAQLAALEQKFKDYEVENTSSKAKGTQDFNTNLSRMGWLADKKTWDAEDKSKAYGQQYQGLMGDFASRGLIQSTLYDQERNNLATNFNQQKGDMESNHTNFLEDLARTLGQQKSNTQLGKDQARVEALARRAAAESGVA